VLTNVVRIKPELTTHVLPYLPRMLKRVDHPTSKAALIFLLGGMELYMMMMMMMMTLVFAHHDEVYSITI